VPRPTLQKQQQQQQQQQQWQEGEAVPAVQFYSLDSQDPFVLWRVRPGFVILYDADLSFLRQLEVYQV
jgi:hypothetical protein